MLRLEDLKTLRCPGGQGELSYAGSLIGDRLWDGRLASSDGREWTVERGIPRLYAEEKIGSFDRVFRLVYNLFGPFHDAAVRYVLPIFQGSSEAKLREGYMRELDLKEAQPERPFRILETGIGAGANLELLGRFLPKHASAEIWGIDLSPGMLREAVGKIERGVGGRPVRIVMADAHDLPFPDGYFDRVFHVGAANTFSDPKRALAEMARVAKPGAPIIVVDEQLHPDVRWNLFLRAGFRVLTFYDADPKAPVALLPEGAVVERVEQLNAFFYCLRWRMPGPPASSAATATPEGPRAAG